MKKEIIATGSVFLCLMSPLKAVALDFSQLFVFGDSLSDTGNAFKATGMQIPPSPPYFEGRTSNGLLWVEYLSSALGLQQTNFAFNGATTGSENTLFAGNPFNFPGLSQQISSFTTVNPNADENGLYVLWAGANDYLGGGVTNPQVPVSRLENAVKSLAAVGAKNFLVVNLPDLSRSPATSDDGSQATAAYRALTSSHNSLLSNSLATLSREQPNFNIYTLDVFTLLNRTLANPQEFGFTNVTDACLDLADGTICTNPNEYLYWDGLHPTTRIHSITADAALAKVRAKSVPEPSVALGTLALSALGIAQTLKRKRVLISSLVD